MLKIDTELIVLQQSAGDAEQAVRAAGKLLERGGYITEAYTEAMIANMKQHGPYFAIAPGFAMPHARPEDGVLKAGIALMTLSTPVSFGSSNDPITLVMPLATSSNEEHLECLSAIAELLDGKETIERLSCCRTVEEVLEIVSAAE